MKPFTILVALLLLTARSARAEDIAPPDAPLPFPGIAQGALPTMTPGHWAGETARLFMSLRFDLGYLYLKPLVSFGYGKPFYAWAGIDIAPFITPDEGGGYSGLRLQLDWFEIRAGGRFVHAFTRDYLRPQPSYTLVDLYEAAGRPVNYLDLEAEASAAIPAGPGNILALFTVESIQLAPAGTEVFDETLHVIVSPPPVYRARLGYSLILGREHAGRLGLLAEDIEIPDREARVIRVGVTGSFDIDDHLQFVATVLIPVYGPDSLGLLGADYTELGLRYRWATGQSHIPQPLGPASELPGDHHP
jgi:hypothetical protein